MRVGERSSWLTGLVSRIVCGVVTWKLFVDLSFVRCTLRGACMYVCNRR